MQDQSLQSRPTTQSLDYGDRQSAELLTAGVLQSQECPLAPVPSNHDLCLLHTLPVRAGAERGGHAAGGPVGREGRPRCPVARRGIRRAGDRRRRWRVRPAGGRMKSVFYTLGRSSSGVRTAVRRQERCCAALCQGVPCAVNAASASLNPLPYCPQSSLERHVAPPGEPSC